MAVCHQKIKAARRPCHTRRRVGVDGRRAFFVLVGKITLPCGHIIAKVAHRDPIKKIKSNINH